jgi:hypothetical protein
VAEIIRSGGDRSADVVAEEIFNVVDRKADLAFPYTRPNKALIINSIRETRGQVRLAGGEGRPIRVLIVPLAL